MRLIRDVSLRVSLGIAAGATAFALDEMLAVLTLQHWLPVNRSHVAIYLGTGAVFALAIWFVAALVKKSLGLWPFFCGTLATLYLVPVCERVVYSLSGWKGTLGAVLVAVGYGVWIAVLGRCLGRKGRATAPLLVAVCAAWILAVNRNLVSSPLERPALIGDLAIFVLTIAVALTMRRFGNRRVLSGLGSLGVLAVGAVLWNGRAPRPPASFDFDRPHLLMLSIDTLRQDVFRSVLENTEEGRAFRDAMAGSAFFSNAAAAAPWTVPSVASIMTGLYPQEHGLVLRGGTMTRMPAAIPTLATHLLDAGYHNEAIVTNPILIPESDIFRGFDWYSVLSGSTSKLPLLTCFVSAGWLENEIYLDASSVRSKLAQRMGDLIDSNGPVFLWLHLMDPHGPWHAHPELPPDPATSGMREIDRIYREETRHTLLELTKMIELLDRYGLWSNAMVVVVSDHGEMFRSDDRIGLLPNGPADHGHALYNELVRVPLILRPPAGLGQSRDLDVLASHVDIRDTVADVLELPIPRFPGRFSLAPYLKAAPEVPDARGWVLLGGLERGPPQQAVRTPRFKFIHFPNGEKSNELYDLEDDPEERRDLASSNARVAGELLELLRAQWSLLATAPESGAVDIDEETRKRLKALGYL